MEYTSHSLQTQKREKTEKEWPNGCTIAGCLDNKLVGAHVYLKRFEKSKPVFIIPCAIKITIALIKTGWSSNRPNRHAAIVTEIDTN